MKKKPVLILAILALIGVGLFLLGSGYVFRKACLRRNYVGRDPEAAAAAHQEVPTDTQGFQDQEAQEVSITAFDGIRLQGYYFEREKGAPLIIFFHGLWSGCYPDGTAIYGISQRQNWNLLLVDLRAHNGSGGNMSTLGVRERYDCRDWARWAASTLGEETPIYLMGVSQGASIVMLSSDLDLPDSVCGIIDDCGYTTPLEMIEINCKEKLPKGFPVGVFSFVVDAGARIWGGFDLKEADACQALAQTKIPVLILHGDKDTVAPLSMAYRLYNSCGGQKELHVFSGADHGESFWKEPERYERILTAFIEKHTP